MGQVGGGGSSGSLDYPTYMKDWHGSILFGSDPSIPDPITDFAQWGNVSDDIIAARAENGGSPYELITAYDPSADLAAIQEKYDDWETNLAEIDPIGSVETAAAAAVNVAVTLTPTAEIDAVANAFEARSRGAYLRNVSRYAAGMFDIQAVMSTQFGMGLAAMEGERAEQVNDVDARLRLMAERERYQSSTAVMSDMVKLMLAISQEKRAGVGMQFDIAKANIVAYQDQLDKDLTLEIKDAQWNLDLWTYGTNAMASISGAAVVPRAQTQGERLLAGISQSAAMALQVGTAMGSVGAGVAAGGISLGALLLLGGLE